MFEKLNVGDLFMVDMRELSYISLSTNGDFYIQNLNKKSGRYDDVYFLLKYLGNNLCEEYYTGKVLQISYPINEPEYYITKYAWHNSNWPMNKTLDKWKLFQELDEFSLKYPLVVEPQFIKDVKTFEIFNNGDKDRVKQNLNHAIKDAKLLYLNSKKEFMATEYMNAYVEYIKDDFKKRALKKG